MQNNSGQKSSDFALPVVNVKSAVQQALQEIAEGLNGEQLYLRTRWNNVNNMLMGGFRFNMIYLISGASGSGKSFLLNMVHQDFMNSELNADYHHPFKILHFNFEMSAADEMLRKVSSKVKVSYRQLLSVDEPLAQDKCDRVYKILQSMDDQTLYYVERAGNRLEIQSTIRKFKDRFPDHNLVVTLDHTLLVKYFDEKSEVELLSHLAKLFIELRKEMGLCVILLGQLNDKIEDPRRRDSRALHYPTKTDIHGSKQLYHAADSVLVLHRPEMLNITQYGMKRYPTEHALFLHQLKARKGEAGLVRLRENFAQGNIEEWEDIDQEEPGYGDQSAE